MGKYNDVVKKFESNFDKELIIELLKNPEKWENVIIRKYHIIIEVDRVYEKVFETTYSEFKIHLDAIGVVLEFGSTGTTGIIGITHKEKIDDYDKFFEQIISRMYNNSRIIRVNPMSDWDDDDEESSYEPIYKDEDFVDEL